MKIFLWVVIFFLILIFSVWIQDESIVKKIFLDNQYLHYICKIIPFSDHCAIQQENNQLTQNLQKRNLKLQFDLFSQWYTLRNYTGFISTPSLYYKITGDIASTIPEDVTLSILYYKENHDFIDVPVTIDKKNLVRTAVFTKQNETMQKGMNKYIIQTKKNGNLISEIPLQVTSQAQEIPIGSSVLYIDLSYSIDSDTNIVTSVPSFDAHISQRITYWCVEENPYKILIKHNLQYKIIDACLSFDEYFQKILILQRENTEVWSNLFYNIYDIDKNLLYKKFPLYVFYYGIWYQNFIAYEDNDILWVYQASPWVFWDNFYYAKVGTWAKKTIEISYDSIGSILLRNNHESLLISLYTTWDRFDSILHPWLYYSYLPYNSSVPISKRSWLIYPRMENAIWFPYLWKPTWNLSFIMKDHNIIIHDGIKEIIYDIIDLKKPTSVKEIPKKSYAACNEMDIKIITLDGHEQIQGAMQKYFLVWSWISHWSINILYENQYLEDFQYSHYFSSLLEPNISLKKWRNTYAVQLKDNSDIILCEKKISILIY